jgi:mycothiol synthase
VHPDHQGAGLGASLLSWGEALSRERGAEGVRTDVVDQDEPGHRLLGEFGYRQVRSSFTMTKEFAANESAGVVPAGVTIRSYADADERVLFDVHEASFADHWGQRVSSFETFTEALHGEDWDPSLVFLAEADDGVVGHVVSFAFEDEGYVALLGVLPAWRGRGIGGILLRRSFAELAARGKRRARLEVDAANPHGAVALYEGAGMEVHRRYDIFDLGTEALP